MLLKLYISSTPIHIPTVTMNKSCRFSTLDTPSLCTYHLLDRSTQQKSCEVEITIFPDFLMTHPPRSKVALIFACDRVLNRALAEQVISSWIFDVFIIWKHVFIILPISQLSAVLCVPHPPEFRITNAHFLLIFQGVLQRIFGMLSVKNGSFSTMLRCFCLLSRHFSAQQSHLTHSPESPHPLSSHQTQADALSPTLDLPSPSHSIPSISE